MVKINTYCPDGDTHTVSIKELAEANDLDYLEAQGLIKSLVKLGIAKMTDPRKIPGAKGKPTNLYILPMCIQVTLSEVVKLAA